jgi:hypothetical protein
MARTNGNAAFAWATVKTFWFEISSGATMTALRLPRHQG